MAITAATPTALDIRFDLAAAAPGVNPYSARGLQGTLGPIAAAEGLDKLGRTVNGTLVDLSAPQMRKYKLEVSGNDQAPPAIDGLWVGALVSVDAHIELAYRTGGFSSRSPVPGSVRTEGNYTYFAPRLAMMVVEYQVAREEWEQAVRWSLMLEEI